MKRARARIRGYSEREMEQKVGERTRNENGNMGLLSRFCAPFYGRVDFSLFVLRYVDSARSIVPRNPLIKKKEGSTH